MDTTTDYGAIHATCGQPHRPFTPCPTTDDQRDGGQDQYPLDCGHVVTVDGPCGPTTGRAWCVECGESSAVLP